MALYLHYAAVCYNRRSSLWQFRKALGGLRDLDDSGRGLEDPGMDFPEAFVARESRACGVSCSDALPGGGQRVRVRVEVRVKVRV